MAGFTAVPLLAGLTVAALVARRWPRLITVGLIAAPTLALSTIAIMTLPADLDPISTVTLALCHVVLAPVAVLALLRLRRRANAAPSQSRHLRFLDTRSHRRVPVALPFAALWLGRRRVGQWVRPARQ